MGYSFNPFTNKLDDSGDALTAGTSAISGLTAGSVLFGGTSGVLQQDNTNFFWDDTNNRLGIGTASPAERLDILGSSSSAIRMQVTNSNSAGAADQFFFNAGGKYFGSQMFGSTASSTFANVTNANLAKFVTSADNFVIGTQGVAPIIFAVNAGATTGEVLRLTAATIKQSFDSSNYYTIAVGSTGVITLDAVGTGSSFLFSDRVELSQALRIDGSTAPSTGSGLELGYGGSTGNIFVYNRTGSVYENLQISGLGIYMQPNANGNTGFGLAGGSTISALIHAIKTTEQLRIGYDISNYVSETVSSTGGITYNAVGSGASFTWSDSINLPYVAKTSTYTATTNDYTIDCTSGTFTVNLPAVSGLTGRIYVIKNSGTGVITADGNASETIDGATTYTLNTQYQSITLQCTGAAWIVV